MVVDNVVFEDHCAFIFQGSKPQLTISSTVPVHFTTTTNGQTAQTSNLNYLLTATNTDQYLYSKQKHIDTSLDVSCLIRRLRNHPIVPLATRFTGWASLHNDITSHEHNRHLYVSATCNQENSGWYFLGKAEAEGAKQTVCLCLTVYSGSVELNPDHRALGWL